MEITSVEPEADRHDHAFRGHFARRFEERALVDHEEYRYGQRFYGLDQVDRGYDLEYGRERSCTVLWLKHIQVKRGIHDFDHTKEGNEWKKTNLRFV